MSARRQTLITTKRRPLASVQTPSLRIAYEQTGPDSGTPIVLLHGFPYDIRQFDAVTMKLAQPSRRIIVPFLRGFGETTYLSDRVIRSGQQAAVGKDVIDLLDALKIERALVAGYDWGGRAACVAAALWPQRISGLLSASGYSIEDIAKNASTPKTVEAVYPLWYQMYLNTKQGEIGLHAHRDDFCEFLWRLWSPSWKFTGDQFLQTAESFRNPDFVATVIQSYRFRYANAPGDPSFDSLEARLASTPKISAPTIVVHGAEDQVEPPATLIRHDARFTNSYRVEVLRGVGHCVPAEAPKAFADAIESLIT